MNNYNKKVICELEKWNKKMLKSPSAVSKMSKDIQIKFNNLLPEKAHIIITEAIKNMVKVVLIGSEYTTKKPLENITLKERESLVIKRLEFYKKTSAVSGAGTGAGGIALGLADFPILLSLKIKFLFDTAALYGYDVKDYKERLYILHIFQLAFCSHKTVKKVYWRILNWNEYVNELPDDINSFEWRSFQQEYRDYMDTAKLLQMLPAVGAIFGAYANYKLMDRLGITAMNAYRLRRCNITKNNLD